MEKNEGLNLDSQVCFPLYVCSKEVIKRYNTFLDELGLTYTQYIVLLVLWEVKEINVKELGQSLFLDSGTLTPLLKKMEDKGLVERKRNKIDERNLMIVVTTKGKKLKEKVQELPELIEKEVGLEPKEHEELYRLLNKLTDNIKNEKEDK